jgi:hypothetical protein
MSRATQGVTLINLGPEEKLAGLQKIVDSDDAGEGLDAGPDEGAAAHGGDDDGQGQNQGGGDDELS